MPPKRRVIILGAAGRDFHNFNVFYRENPGFFVCCFTASQIPGISGRKYPASLAGKNYPNGIRIFPEEKLASLIKRFKANEVVLSYSDLSHNDAMHKASIALANGASFSILGPDDTMLQSSKPVIAVCAVRTGCGKSQLTLKIAKILKARGKKPAIVRHPMPYGNLKAQELERFARASDLKKGNCTVEEREEFEPLIRAGLTVYAGVDYAKILRSAEKEADVVIWDGGNNDFPFYKPDLMFCVADALRPGHELLYHPGESNFRAADVIVVNKMNSASPKGVEQLLENAKSFNPKALLIEANSEISAEGLERIKGKRVIVVEDGPSITHGGLPLGAASIAVARNSAFIADCSKHAAKSIKETFRKFPHLHNVLPAMGYSKKQLSELERTINRTEADFVVSGTPADLSRLIKCNKPIIQVNYSIEEIGKPSIEQVLKKRQLI